MLTVFTKEYGKLQVKAAGVRRITSRRSSHVELLNYSVLHVYKGAGLPVLTEAQTIDNFSPIKNNLIKVGYAYHLCELIDGLCPENQENRRVFLLLKNMLSQLSQHDTSVREDYTIKTIELELHDEAPRTRFQATDHLSSAIQRFEIELLSVLGYWNRADVLSRNFDTHDFIETILERKLKSKKIFSKLQ